MANYEGIKFQEPVAIVGSALPRLQAEVVASEPAANTSGLVVWPINGYADRPLRIDPTGTTVQPVSITSGTITIGTVQITGNVGGILDAILGATKPPNVLQVGGNDGTNAYAIPLASGGTSVIISGAVTTSGTATVIGGLTNNNAAPTTTNVGALVAIANAAVPTWTEGDQVLLSEDLSGHLRVVATGAAATGVAAVGNPLLISGQDYAGNVQPLATDTTGKPRVVGATMNPAIIQGALGAPLTNVAIASTTCVKAYGSAVKLGNTLVVIAATGALQSVTITDSLNLQWQTAILNGATASVYAFFAIVTVAGTPTVTITTASTDIAMALYEVEGAGVVESTSPATLLGAGGTSAISVVCAVTQPNNLAFFAVAAGAQVISAASPNQPYSSVFDTGNIAVAGASALKNFGAFSAQLGSQIVNANGNSQNITNTFKATLAGNAIFAAGTFAFRPAAAQVNASGSINVGVNTLSSVSSAIDAIANSSVESQKNDAGTAGVWPATGLLLYNGSTWDRQRTPSVFRSASGSAATNTIWTPATGKKFRLMRYKIEGTANLVITTAGVIPIYLQDGTTPIQGISLLHSIFLPSTAATTLAGAWDSDWIDLGNGYLSSTAANPLILAINGPLASTTVNAGFTQTSTPWESIQELFKTSQTAAAGPAAQLIQSAVATPVNTTTIAKAYPSANVAGNTLIVVVTANNNGAITIADTLTNSWTSSTAQTTSTTHTTRVFYVVNCKSGANTVTATATSGQLKMLIFEYVGITSADSTSGTTGSSTTPAPGNATAAATSDFVFSVAGNAGNALAIAAAGAFRLVASSSDAAGSLSAEDNLAQLPSGLAGAFNVVCAGTEE